MHSRIFQLSDEKINKDDFITEENFYEDSFIGSVADYVSDNIDRKEDIKWLMSCLEPYGVKLDKEEESIVFPKGFKQRYFEERFKKFKETVNGMTLNDFCDSIKAWQLSQIIEKKFDFYIYVSYPQPLDDFIRDLEEEKKYFIGGIVDYHA
ncbi:MAG: hypothetical protein GXY91_05485 [Clostridia bacterium]|nr:hypothetical protein [Clostridia bacterium]